MNVAILNSRNLSRSEVADSISTIEHALSTACSAIELSSGPGFIKRIGGRLLPSSKTLEKFQKLGCSFEQLDENKFKEIDAFLTSSLDSFSFMKLRWELSEGHLADWTNLSFSFSCGKENGAIYVGVYCGFWKGAETRDRLQFFEAAIGLGLGELIEVRALDDKFELMAREGASIDFPISEAGNKNPHAFRIHGLRSFAAAKDYCLRLKETIRSGALERNVTVRFDNLDQLRQFETPLNELVPNCNGQMIAGVKTTAEEFLNVNNPNSIESMPILSAWFTGDGPEVVVNLVRTREFLHLEMAVIGGEHLKAFDDFMCNSEKLQNLGFGRNKTDSTKRTMRN